MPVRKTILLAVTIGLAALTGIFLASCGVATDRFVMDTPQEWVETAPVPPAEQYIGEERDMYKGEPAPPGYEIIDQRVGETVLRHVIQRGSIDLSVRDTKEKIQEVRTIVEKAEGLVSNLYVYEIREGHYGARMTLRIPDKHFEAVMDQLENLGKANNIRTELEDVTMQYIDLESRLKNQKAQERRLTEILAMAETVEEVLEVERELSRVRGEIESMTARLTSMEDQIKYATIDLSLREEAIPTETVSPLAFHNLGRRIMAAFIGSINFILNSVSFLIIVLSALIPVIFILVVIGAIIWLLVRRHSKRRALKKEPAERP